MLRLLLLLLLLLVPKVLESVAMCRDKVVLTLPRAILLYLAILACGSSLGAGGVSPVNDSLAVASTGSRDARFLAFGEGLTSEEFSLYPVQWGERGAGESTARYDDGSELVRLVEGGSDLSPDPYELIRWESDASKYGEGTGAYRKQTSGDISRTPLDTTVFQQDGELGVTTSYYPTAAALQSQDEPVVMTAAPSLSRVSAFVRGMLQRFGIYQYIEAYQSKGGGSESGSSSTTSGPSSNIQRGIPHRFRPHFVNTAKGLRNIPAQLNDGQLQLAPEDGVTGSDGSLVSGGQPGLQTGGGGAGSTTGSTSKAPGSSAGGGGTGGTISSLFNAFKRKVKAIYPGTVWCGDGNQAKSENDIGFFYLTDSCCRAHDLCPITIAAGEQFNRLKNNGYFTRSHCDCDKQFFNCLKNANTLVSRQIGYTYFNLLKPQCFRHEHPKLNCTKRSKGKCISYVVDEKQSKRWQWFDNLIF
ncbi:uncharacterized protein LOC121590421 isoform X1 [Anopheles merus]|uniref:uncharacterized protein LOC121590421 isoform X1 n=1 Tax=Anopheles merus TaxID=30066 RepID=UPI001BE4721F|nr:uncharacterized protein LOC121590421 isoform X1 [Anopheles merus]